MPIMNVNWNAVKAQVEIGCKEFARHFGKRPQGIWLLECGYSPGVVFFFQAEDGIRDADVTGVQTSALPIWCSKNSVSISAVGKHQRLETHLASLALGHANQQADIETEFFEHLPRDLDLPLATVDQHHAGHAGHTVAAIASRIATRSEERRVGKESRSRWAPDR